MSVSTTTRPYGRLEDGTEIEAFTLASDSGIELEVMTYGCIITSIRMPDRLGERSEITLGYPSLEGYTRRQPYFGALVGRFANRIAFGRFELDGTTYALATNNGRHHLHGGVAGFDRHVWHATPFLEDDGAHGVRFSRQSPDGEEGYPGALDVTYDLVLCDEWSYEFRFRAMAHAPTIVNLTNHTYYNLSGDGDIRDHIIQVHADEFVPTDAEGIPLAQKSVADTPWDLRKPTSLGAAIEATKAQSVRSLDTTFVVRDWSDDGTLREIAEVYAPTRGRRMKVATSYPSAHIYDGGNLTGVPTGGGDTFDGHEGLCIECQFFPDTPNHQKFPSVVLRPGENYAYTTRHSFSVDE